MMGEDITIQKKEVFMTVAEQLRREGFEKGVQFGMRNGVLNAIEMGLKIRFGADGLKLMPRIRKIQNIERLRAIQAALYTVKDLSEFHQTMAAKSPKREPRPSSDET